jgi:hypothetical protein
MRYPLSEQALNELGKLLVRSIKDQLQLKKYPYGHPEKGQGDKVASGKLLQSISYQIVSGPDGQPIIQLNYQDYLKYVNRGRKPNTKEVPIKALLDWIKVRGIRGRTKKGRFMSNLSLAFAMRTNIYKFGIRPARIFDESYDGLEYYFEDFPNNLPPDVINSATELFDAITDDINNLIDNTIRKEIPSDVKVTSKKS